MDEEYTLTQDEAAQILGVSTRRFRQLVEGRWIRRVSRGQYDANQVHQLKRLREKSVGFTEVAMQSQRADMSSRQTERVVRQLLAALDVGYSLISLEKEDVEALHMRVEDELELYYQMSIEEVTQWTHTFNSMGEEYFEAVEMHLGVSEPWLIYWQLLVKMLREAPRERLRKEKYLELAYSCLHKAREHFDRIAYFYAVERHGKVRALTAFKAAKGDAHDDIVNIAIWHAKKRKKR